MRGFWVIPDRAGQGQGISSVCSVRRLNPRGCKIRPEGVAAPLYWVGVNPFVGGVFGGGDIYVVSLPKVSRFFHVGRCELRRAGELSNRARAVRARRAARAFQVGGRARATPDARGRAFERREGGGGVTIPGGGGGAGGLRPGWRGRAGGGESRTSSPSSRRQGGGPCPPCRVAPWRPPGLRW